MFACVSLNRKKKTRTIRIACKTCLCLTVLQGLNPTYLKDLTEEELRPEADYNFKPAAHLAILYADCGDRRKSPGVPGAAIAIFADRRDRRKSPISGMSDIGD